jgi:integrase
MSDMPRPRPPYLQRRVTRHGKVAWYVRVGRGPLIPVKGIYGSPEFMAAYDDAVRGIKPKAPGIAAEGTLQWLVDLYRKSEAWNHELSASTRARRGNHLNAMCTTAGAASLTSIDRQAIIEGRDRRAKHPSQARQFVQTARSLFSWALLHGHVAVDPTQLVKIKPTKSKGHRPWDEDDIIKFEARWPRGTRQRVMLDVYAYTGLRRGDAAAVGRQHVRDGVITLDNEKTGMRVTIPILPALRATLDAGPVGDLAFIAQKSGASLTKKTLGNTFRAACKAAGIIGKSAHGLRKAAATRAANNGATVAELEAIFGWSGGQMAALYTRSADRKRLAAGAMDKLSRNETGTSMLPPPQKVVAPARKTK